MSDLVKRLRAYSGRTIHKEAADRIAELQAQVDAVRDAIKIKPHLEHPVGDQDCERVRVYQEIQQALEQKP